MSGPQPDLREARRLLGAGMWLVELVPYTKRPVGLEWNKHAATAINPEATGYGIPLAANKLCSLDPDNVSAARTGMAALGFDLDELMAAGVQTRSTRQGSGGRSTFAAEGELTWLAFRSSATGTVIEFRADSPNLQDCIPGVVYRDKDGATCTQQYANGKRLDDAPPLPQDLYAWWARCSTDVEFLRGQERRFFAALDIDPHLSISAGKGAALAYGAPCRTAYNRVHDVEDILGRHGYTYDRRTRRWAPPTATGAAGVRPIPGKDGLWRSDHASDPLMGTFDAWTAHVVLDHQGNLEAAVAARTHVPPHDQAPPLDVIAEQDGSAAPESDVPLFITADSLRDAAVETRPPIIEEVLLEGATLVHGPAKKGKSWVLLQMTTAIDDGGEFLGKKAIRREVLFVGAEDDSARLKSRLERMAAWGTAKFMTRAALTTFATRLRRAMPEGEPITAEKAVETLWEAAGRPGVIVIDTQEVFEVLLGITHGKHGDSITRRDYQATSSYDGLAKRLHIAIVLVGHWGEIKSIQKATSNPHECLNTTKARLAGVTTSITLGPLPNQEPGEATRDMQLSIRSRDLAGGDQFLWVQQSEETGAFRSLGAVRDVLLTEAQGQLFGALIAAYQQHGEDHWTSASDLADELDVSVQAVKQMVGRVRKSAKLHGRKCVCRGYELQSKPNKGYRAQPANEGGKS